MPNNQSFNYTEKQQQLEAIIEELQDGSLNIDESIDNFNKAQQLIIELEKYLKNSQIKVNKIIDKQ